MNSILRDIYKHMAAHPLIGVRDVAGDCDIRAFLCADILRSQGFAPKILIIRRMLQMVVKYKTPRTCGCLPDKEKLFWRFHCAAALETDDGAIIFDVPIFDGPTRTDAWLGALENCASIRPHKLQNSDIQFMELNDFCASQGMTESQYENRCQKRAQVSVRDEQRARLKYGPGMCKYNKCKARIDKIKTGCADVLNPQQTIIFPSDNCR